MKRNKYVNKHVSVATVVERDYSLFLVLFHTLSHSRIYSYIPAISISDKFVERISHLCLVGLRGICKD